MGELLCGWLLACFVCVVFLSFFLVCCFFLSLLGSLLAFVVFLFGSVSLIVCLLVRLVLLLLCGCLIALFALFRSFFVPVSSYFFVCLIVCLFVCLMFVVLHQCPRIAVRA